MTGRPATRVGVVPARVALLHDVARRIAVAGAVRVGLDGVDGAGKTTFADDLATALRDTGKSVVRVSIDGFHHPREVRYRRGRSSPEGFWLDSYDYDRFRTDVIEPFALGGDRRYRHAIRDVVTDAALEPQSATAPRGAILIVDGIFLHRDELAECWDFSVFLHAQFEETYRRMALRDGCPSNPNASQNHRYLQGQRLYLAECAPQARASVVIDNTDPACPRIITAPQPR